MWLQNRREATVERTRTTSSVRRDDPGEFRVGRLKHERVKVPRGESLMEWAENVMQMHADRKSVLEVTSCQVKLFVFLWERMHGNQGSYLLCKPWQKTREFPPYVQRLSSRQSISECFPSSSLDYQCLHHDLFLYHVGLGSAHKGFYLTSYILPFH